MKIYLRIFSLVLFGLLIVSLSAPRPAYAAPINVGCDANELIAAINTANSTPEEDTLELAADCVYALTAINNTDEDNGPTGLPIITSEITVNGHNATIARSEDVPGFRILRVAPTGSLLLNQVTVTRGQPDKNPHFTPFYHGAGILNRHGQVTLHSSTVTKNILYDYAVGGGIYNDGGMLNVADSLVADNGRPDEGDAGGGIANVGGGTLTITDSTIRGNCAIDDGGGIFNLSDGTVTNSRIEGNCTFQEIYEPPASFGGGIKNLGTMTLTGTTISGNTASFGAGISNGGTLNLLSSTVANNTTLFSGEHGGGIENLGTMLIANSTVARNFATKQGGAVWNSKSLRLINVTLAKNHAGDAGGNVFTTKEGTMTASNTIFAKGKPENCVGVIVGEGSNLRFPTGDSSCLGTYGNPKLGPLQDNGGPTWTMALKPGSAAIDIGREPVCAADPINNLDQRGIVRPLDGNGSGLATCDSGAFEAPALPAPTCTDKPQAPVLVVPVDQATVHQKAVRLNWNESYCATRFKVEVREGSADGDKVFTSKGLTITEDVAEGLKWNRTYLWRVKACNAIGCRASAYLSFTVEQP